jgi:hypothetical protein
MERAWPLAAAASPSRAFLMCQSRSTNRYLLSPSCPAIALAVNRRRGNRWERPYRHHRPYQRRRLDCRRRHRCQRLQHRYVAGMGSCRIWGLRMLCAWPCMSRQGHSRGLLIDAAPMQSCDQVLFSCLLSLRTTGLVTAQSGLTVASGLTAVGALTASSTIAATGTWLT